MAYKKSNPNGQATTANSEPVVIASDQTLPLPTGASTSAKQDTIIGHVDGIEGLLTTIDADTGGIATSTASLDTKTPALGQALAAASTPVVLTAAQMATLTPPAAITGFLTESDFDTKTGSLTETAPATDTSSSGLNGRLQRVAQRITSLITVLGSPFQAGGSIGNLFALDTTLATTNTEIGIVTETAPASDTASSGLNGRLQRIAQRITSLIALIPTSLGQGTMATSMKVVLPSDQASIPVAATLGAETTKVIGTVRLQDGAGTALTTTSSNLDVNVKAINGVAPTMGNGASGTGVQRVTIADNSTGIVGLAAGNNNIGDIDIVSHVPGTAATNLGKAEDAGHTTGDVGVMALGVRSDAGASGNPTALATTSLDYIPLATDANNRLYVNDAGDIAHDAVDSTSNPVKIGGQARTTNPTAVADADRVNAIFDKMGKQIVVNSIRDLKGVQQTTITSSTSETTIVTAVASTFLDLYGLIITNTSATVTKVTIKDSTAGTTRAVIEIPATETRGFMLTESAAIPQATVNNNWTATCGTSVSAIEITALYVKNL